MIISKKTVFILSLVFSLGLFSLGAYAEEAAKTSVHSPNVTIMHLERAKVEIMHNDFMPPSENLKEARAESKNVTGKPDIVNKAYTCIVQAQTKLNEGDKKGAADEINKALDLYNSLNK
jgi:hypothetical protein